MKLYHNVNGTRAEASWVGGIDKARPILHFLTVTSLSQQPNQQACSAFVCNKVLSHYSIRSKNLSYLRWTSDMHKRRSVHPP